MYGVYINYQGMHKKRFNYKKQVCKLEWYIKPVGNNKQQIQTFLPESIGGLLVYTSLLLGKSWQPPVSSRVVSLSSWLPPSNGSHIAQRNVTVWFWDRIKLPDRDGWK